MNAGIILTVPFLQNPAITAVLLITPATSVHHANPLPLLPVEIPMIAPGTRTVPAQFHHPAPVIADTAPMLLSLCQPANATITLPASGISVTMAAHSFWSSATINGGPLVTSHLLVGYDNRYATSHATFNVPVTVNGLITLGNDSTATFNKGISGSYTCRKCTAPSGQTSCKDITCPF